jgi:Flp pilus assembly pilin Flp
MSPLSLSFLRALAVARRASRALHRDRRGQATAEYALVLLGAAAIALLLAAWAAKSGAISSLFDAVVDQLVDEVG